jgi:beta-lactamase regulating signal transducer with metallopeptidase domain
MHTQLFASGGEAGIAILLILWVIGYLGYQIYVFFARPELFAQWQREAHEKEMAAAEARRGRTGRIAGSIAGGIAKVLLGGVFRHKH